MNGCPPQQSRPPSLRAHSMLPTPPGGSARPVAGLLLLERSALGTAVPESMLLFPGLHVEDQLAWKGYYLKACWESGRQIARPYEAESLFLWLQNFVSAPSLFLLFSSLPPQPTPEPLHRASESLCIKQHHFSLLVFNLSLIGIAFFQLHEECLCGFITYADKSFGKHDLLLQ